MQIPDEKSLKLGETESAPTQRCAWRAPRRARSSSNPTPATATCKFRPCSIWRLPCGHRRVAHGHLPCVPHLPVWSAVQRTPFQTHHPSRAGAHICKCARRVVRSIFRVYMKYWDGRLEFDHNNIITPIKKRSKVGKTLLAMCLIRKHAF